MSRERVDDAAAAHLPRPGHVAFALTEDRSGLSDWETARRPRPGVRLAALEVPYLVVLGNHDMLGRGDEIFDRMFGMRDGTFEYRGARFLMIDTNSRAYGFGEGMPRLASLAAALHVDGGAASAPALATPTFLFAHVPPISSDFDPDQLPQ